jgi:hypothetical protein
VRRGVVFVKEIVPRWAIASVARICFGEKYVALPMAHKVIEPTSEGGRIQTEYRWRHRGRWNAIRAESGGRSAVPPADSREAFFIEHYWGYATDGKGGTVEYRVEHDRWRTWPVSRASFEGDVSELYGAPLAACLAREPDSALVAEGSSVAVHGGTRI